ncbi:putative amino acid aminotransferase [Sphingomonas changbaiensis NBRC 104936]|uniref:Putative amino acid aminotransferase n=2 Tax=Sphingomonas changbaiensis TaxID=529705 RepID=A0A0E9MLN9_9SPHN|nr:putative amino acid aminotransferase [Sphingomonas changbaiensis NBRC 104936]
MLYVFLMATILDPAPSLAPAAPADAGIFDALALQPADPLLSVIGAFRADPRPNKIDVGVGVFRTETGETPVFRAMKTAERRLLETQDTKAYLGPEGDIGFFQALRPVVFGAADPGERVFGLQTPGGTGALRLAAELIAQARPGARVFLGTPTWPNHPPILKKTGLEQVAYRHFDAETQAVCFDDVVAALESAGAGDVALLQVCCHNPTGADFTVEQWHEIARILGRRGVLPLLDLAYQGLAEGLDADAAGVRIVLDQVPAALIAYSCDKNFGLYRERTGALFGIAASGERARIAHSNVLALARAAWSMPPDHGAAAARIILVSPELSADWRAELAEMRDRIVSMRELLGTIDPAFAPLARQHGMFSTLPLSPEQVRRLREEFAVYMPNSGRINIAGLTRGNVEAFVRAVKSVL